MKLYHGTSSLHIPGILNDGLKGPSCWGSEAVALFFANRECEEAGGKPALISIELEKLDPTAMAVDEQMLDFPVLTDIAGADHGVLEDAWERSKQTWCECLEIYQSVVVTSSLSVSNDMIIVDRRAHLPKMGL